MNATTPRSKWNHAAFAFLWLAYFTYGRWAPWCAHSLSRWYHVSQRPSFSKLNHIPLNGHATFCLSVHPRIDAWVASSFRLLWIMRPWTWVTTYPFVSLLLILWYKPTSGIARPCGVIVFNFLSNCHTVFHSGCTILRSHHQCIRIPVSPHLCYYFPSFLPRSLLPVFLPSLLRSSPLPLSCSFPPAILFLFLLFWVEAILMHVRWSFTVIFIFLSLMASAVEYFFMC